IARERLADLVVGRVRVLAQQVRRRNHEPRRAEAALHGARLDERLLHGMQAVPVGEPFDGDDLVPLGLRSEDEARAHEGAVEQDRARAALSLLAGVLRAVEAEALAQRVQEALALPNVRLVRLPIDRQRDLHRVRHRSRARVTSTRNAWRRYALEPRTSSIGLAAAATCSGKASASSSAAVTSVGTGPAEPKAAERIPRSRSTPSASETTAITIALRGPTFMKVC